MGAVVVVYGPKGAGKSWVAGELARLAGVHHVDADRLVLDLLARGVRPDPRLGWLDHVETAVRDALAGRASVSVEATGAWDSDWLLADRLTAAGHRVLPVWVTAPLAVTLDRLAAGRTGKVPVTGEEARRIHAEATRRAAGRSFAAVVDATDRPDPAALRRIAALLA